MIVSVFCTPGGHSRLVSLDDPMRVPDGWTKVAADVIPAPVGPDDPWTPGIWYADPTSTTMVLCCPDHPIINPKENDLS